MQSYAGYLAPRARCVVEFGCGEGKTGREFRQIQPACRYIGIDQDPAKLQSAVKVLDQVEQSDFSSLELGHHGIYAADCLLYHSRFVCLKGLPQKLAEQAALLREGGQVVFVLENPGYYAHVLSLWRGEALAVDTSLTMSVLLHILEQAGLKIDRIHSEYDLKDRGVRESQEMQSLLHSFVSLCQKMKLGAKTDIWAKRFVVVAGKMEPPAPGMMIQTFIGEHAACAKVRVHEPDKFCQTMFNVHCEVDRNLVMDLGHARPYRDKIVIRQRMQINKPEALRDMVPLIREGFLFVFEIDDNPFLWKKAYERMYYADFTCCHAIQVSTPALAELMKPFNPNIVVFRNQLERLPAPRVYAAEDAPVTLFFGALNRWNDWKEIMPVINEALHKYGDKLQVKVLFDQKFYEALETENKEFCSGQFPKNFAPYEVYEQVLRSSDIALLPLLDTQFNAMKSDLKFIECAGNGTVVLASPTVYEDTVRHGRTGFIYHDVEEFRNYLFLLIEDRERRLEVARDAYAYVRENRLLSQHYEERIAFYRSLSERKQEIDGLVLKRIADVLQKLEVAVHAD